MGFDFVQRLPHFAMQFQFPPPVAGIAIRQCDALECGGTFHFIPRVDVLHGAGFDTPDGKHFPGSIQSRVMVRTKTLKQNGDPEFLPVTVRDV